MKYKNLQKNNEGLAPYRRCKPSGAGFVILFAVTISSILLAIALGVSNIALKEVKFGTNARDTNNAFFAADTGAERALFIDKPPGSACDPPCASSFVISGLGSSGQSCVKVTIGKTVELTTIISKGYNIGNDSCNSTNPDRVERELKVTY